MNITVQYFGMLADITGQAVENWLTEEILTVGALREKIGAKYPELKMKKYKVAVNLQISEDRTLINPASEIALLPPFAGG